MRAAHSSGDQCQSPTVAIRDSGDHPGNSVPGHRNNSIPEGQHFVLPPLPSHRCREQVRSELAEFPDPVARKNFAGDFSSPASLGRMTIDRAWTIPSIEPRGDAGVNLILEVVSGPAAGRKLHLKAGQAARIGRTEWADFAVGDDRALADIHFAIECDGQGGQVRDLSGAAGTIVNDEPVQGTARVTSGTTIKAGQSQFVVHFDGAGISAPLRSTFSPQTKSPTSSTAPAEPAVADAPALCEKLSLSPAAVALAKPGMSAASFAEALTQSKQFADALRVVAFTLPKPRAVVWGSQMIRSIPEAQWRPVDEAAIKAAEEWAHEPSESLRRAAQSAADGTKMQTAAGWLAMAAFWSGGSLAPADLPPVPPGESLTCQAITGALLLVAAVAPVSKMSSRFEAFLRAGLMSLQQTAF